MNSIDDKFFNFSSNEINQYKRSLFVLNDNLNMIIKRYFGIFSLNISQYERTLFKAFKSNSLNNALR